MCVPHSELDLKMVLGERAVPQWMSEEEFTQKWSKEMTEGSVQETANNGKNGVEMPQECDQHHSTPLLKQEAWGEGQAPK